MTCNVFRGTLNLTQLINCVISYCKVSLSFGLNKARGNTNYDDDDLVDGDDDDDRDGVPIQARFGSRRRKKRFR